MQCYACWYSWCSLTLLLLQAILGLFFFPVSPPSTDSSEGRPFLTVSGLHDVVSASIELKQWCPAGHSAHTLFFFESPKVISLILRLVYWKCSLVFISTADLHIHKTSNDPLTEGFHSGTVAGCLINHRLRPTAIWFAILLRTECHWFE